MVVSERDEVDGGPPWRWYLKLDNSFISSLGEEDARADEAITDALLDENPRW